jgi:nucleoid DNA-binding protein
MVFDSMVHALHLGDKVKSRGFGSFGTRQRAARFGRNPKTGVRVDLLLKKSPVLQMGQTTSRTG